MRTISVLEISVLERRRCISGSAMVCVILDPCSHSDVPRGRKITSWYASRLREVEIRLTDITY